MANALITIPARAGSNGIKYKNQRKIGEISLLDRAIGTALAMDVTTVVTTDLTIEDKGHFLLHKRDPALCTDTALAWDVWRDAARAAQSHYKRSFSYHLYLEPTSPLRTVNDIKMALYLLQSHNSVCSVSRAPVALGKMFTLKEHRLDEAFDPDSFLNNRPRQQVANVHYVKNGIFYGCSDIRMRTADTMVDSRTYCYEITHPTVNIDTEVDLLLAEALLDE
jgi:CMP-N,N'-diacetyllegionaminic acid synthase